MLPLDAQADVTLPILRSSTAFFFGHFRHNPGQVQDYCQVS